MTKAITASENYEFCLSDELKVMTETELRETCATRDFALQALRDWIEANPRIAASRMGKFTMNLLFSSTLPYLYRTIAMFLDENIPSFIFQNLDANFLLRFLRAKKFSVPITCEGIERYLLLRQSYEFFSNLDMSLPTMKILLDAG